MVCASVSSNRKVDNETKGASTLVCDDKIVMNVPKSWISHHSGSQRQHSKIRVVGCRHNFHDLGLNEYMLFDDIVHRDSLVESFSFQDPK